MAFSMHYQVRLSHEPSVTSFVHAFVCLDCPVNDFVLIQLSLKAKQATTRLTRYLFLVLMFILVNLEGGGYVKHFVALCT